MSVNEQDLSSFFERKDIKSSTKYFSSTLFLSDSFMTSSVAAGLDMVLYDLRITNAKPLSQ